MKVKEILDFAQKQGGRIHLIGVLGAGQRGIAELLLGRGFRVSGSDLKSASEAAYLTELGLEYHSSHTPANVSGAALVAYSLAISEDNAEYRTAISEGIPTVSRAELAATLTDGKRTVCVAGTHGKSTVVAMLAHLLSASDRSPTVLSGARLECGSYSLLGTGDVFVAEACEYKDSFLRFKPSVAVVNNVEYDHADFFGDVDAVKRSFIKYASRAEDFAIINSDDPISEEIIPSITAPVITFGSGESCDYRYSLIAVGEARCIFSVASKRHGELGEFELCLPGIFNVSNATAAIAVCAELGVDAEALRRALPSFKGVERRLEYIGTYRARPVFYDYAHHPTEITVGIDAVRAAGFDPVTVVFKPHTYSRTESLFSDFVRSLSCADYLIVGEIFAAREENLSGISAKTLAKAAGGIFSSDEDVAETLDNLTRGTIIIMGAADMNEILRAMKLK